MTSEPATTNDPPRGYELQLVLINVAEAVRDIDLGRLHDLDDQQFAAQDRARWELYRYLDDLWAHLKVTGTLDVLEPPARQGLAGLRDLAGTLCADSKKVKAEP